MVYMHTEEKKVFHLFCATQPEVWQKWGVFSIC